MKKIISVCLLITIVTTVLVGCGTEQNSSKNDYRGMKQTSFKNISFYVYKEWKEGDESEEGESANMYYYPSKGMLMINVQDTDLDLKDESTWQSVMDGVKSGFENYIQRSLKKYKVNGCNGFRATYSGNISDTDTTSETVAFTTKYNQLIVFSMVSYSKNKNFYHKQFEKVLSSIKIDKWISTVGIEDDEDIDAVTEVEVPDEYLSALEDAESYANDQHMSKKSLYKQLTSEYGEGYSKKAAKYAIKNVKTDWKENALYTADSYANDQHMSKKELYNQLVSKSGEQFTKKQAKYAVEHVKANWKKNALITAKEYMEDQGMSKQEVYEQLVSPYGEQFTVQEAQYAVNHLK